MMDVRVIKKDKVRNEHIRGITRLLQAAKKVTKKHLKWYGIVMKIDTAAVQKEEGQIDGQRERTR